MSAFVVLHISLLMTWKNVLLGKISNSFDFKLDQKKQKKTKTKNLKDKSVMHATSFCANFQVLLPKNSFLTQSILQGTEFDTELNGTEEIERQYLCCSALPNICVFFRNLT